MILPTNSNKSISNLKTDNDYIQNYDVDYSIRSLSISENANYFAVGTEKTLLFFKKTNISHIWNYPKLCESCGYQTYSSIAISNNGNRVAALSLGIDYFYFTKNNNTYVSQYHEGISSYRLHKVDISSDGKYIAIGARSSDYHTDLGKVMFFTNTSNTPLWVYNSNYSIISLAMSSDGNNIVAGDDENSIYLFNRSSSKPIWKFKSEGSINDIAISGDGNYIIAGTGDNKIYLFRNTENQSIWTFNSSGPIGSVSISENGRFFVAGERFKKSYLFCIDESEPIWIYNEESNLKKVCISSDGLHIAVAYSKSTTLLSNTISLPLWTYDTTDYISDIAISKDGNYVLIADTSLTLISSDYRDPPPPLGSEFIALIFAGVYFVVLVAISLIVKTYLINKKDKEVSKENYM